MGLLLLLCLASFFLLTPPAFAQGEFNLDLDPQLEFIDSSAAVQAERGLLQIKSRYKTQHFLLSAEAFGILDGAPNLPALRSEQNYAALQEAFIEYRVSSFSFRIGRQPVRWSESWTLPSLDIWTARRWNQLFFLPVPYQLVHPTGALLNFDHHDTSISAFLNLLPAHDQYPSAVGPIPPSSNGVEYGLRAKQRVFGFDIAGVTAHQNNRTLGGGNISYAFDWVVPKVEGGGDDQQDRFITLGLDFFFDQWSILPQVTSFSSSLIPQEYQRLFYIPVRYANDFHTLELQAYINLDTQDQFYSALYSYAFARNWQATIYYQNYFGLSGSLFGYYTTLTNDNVVGVRLGATFSL